MRTSLVAVAGLVASSALAAATIESLDVAKHRSRYSFEADTLIDATPESIYAVLVDYDDNRFSRISGAYKESRYLDPAPDGTPIIYTRMEGCLLWYCMNLERTERLVTERPYYIKSEVIPEESNFKFATTEFELEPEGHGTRMTYKLELEPDFWVPPLVGPWYLKRTLSRGGARAVMRIERLARMLDGRPVEPSPLNRPPAG